MILCTGSSVFPCYSKIGFHVDLNQGVYLFSLGDLPICGPLSELQASALVKEKAAAAAAGRREADMESQVIWTFGHFCPQWSVLTKGAVLCTHPLLLQMPDLPPEPLVGAPAFNDCCPFIPCP